MTRVIVHIDRLVLRGIHPQDRHAIAEGLQAELGRLLAAAGAATQLTHRVDQPRLSIGRIRIGVKAAPGDLGRLTGAAVAGRLAP